MILPVLHLTRNGPICSPFASFSFAHEFTYSIKEKSRWVFYKYYKFLQYLFIYLFIYYFIINKLFGFRRKLIYKHVRCVFYLFSNFAIKLFAPFNWDTSRGSRLTQQQASNNRYLNIYPIKHENRYIHLKTRYIHLKIRYIHLKIIYTYL